MGEEEDIKEKPTIVITCPFFHEMHKTLLGGGHSGLVGQAERHRELECDLSQPKMVVLGDGSSGKCFGKSSQPLLNG